MPLVASWRRPLQVSLGACLALLGLGALAAWLQPGDVTVRDPGWAIPPGREEEVLALLGAFDGAFAGYELGDVRIEQSEIRVALRPSREGGRAGSCEGPPWVESPGALRVTLRASGHPEHDALGVRDAGPFTLAWWLCGEAEDAPGDATADAAAAAARMAHSGDEVASSIWLRLDAVAPPAPRRQSLLQPLGTALGGMDLRWLAALLWALSAAVALGVPRLVCRAETLEPEPAVAVARGHWMAPWIGVCVVVAGGALRVLLASTMPLDGDEHWAFPLGHSIFGGHHDPAVHPPLFRALQEGWGGLIRWEEHDPLLWLRVPSLLASIAALALLANAVQTVYARRAPPLALAFVALSPMVTADVILARPYGLTAAAFTVLVVALFAPARGAPGLERLRLQTALAALAVTAWLDLVAGVTAALALATYLALPGVRWRTRLGVGLAAVVVLAPLAPGAVVALQDYVFVAAPTADVAPIDLGPADGLGEGDWLRAAGALASFASIGAHGEGVFLAIAIAWWIGCIIATPKARRGALVALVAVWLASIGVGMHVGLRPRNVLFLPHLGALVGAIALGAVPLGARTRRGTKVAP